MTLRHFKIFLCVCREKNMTKAAKKLYMTQPSVTQAVKEMEEYYGVLLFERIGKKIIITDKGYKLIQISEHIIEYFEKAENTMKEKEKMYKLRVGASVTIGTYILSKIIKKIDKNIDIEYIIDNTKNIEEMILDSKIDIGFVEGEVNSKYINKIPIVEDELVFVCSSKHKLAEKEKIYIKDISESKFIFREEGSGTKTLIESIFYNNGIKVDSIGSVNNIEAIKNMIIDDIGISILPKISIRKEQKEGVIKYFNIENIVMLREFKIVYHKDKVISHQMRIFIEETKKNCI